MSERMNKEQAIKILEDILANIMNTKTRGESDKTISQRRRYIKALDIAIESLKQDQETKEKMWAKQLNECDECKILNNEWIDVRDRLPSENKNDKYKEYYITIFNEYTKSIYVDEAYYIDKEWVSTMEDYDCEIKSFEDVIAWKIKHIPEPYKRSDK